MKKLCVLLVIVFAVVLVSGQVSVFAGDQNTEQHENREDSQVRPGDKDAGGEETEKREQAKDPDDKP